MFNTSAGEEFVAFLVFNPRGEPVTIGLAQGKFHVWRDPQTGEKFANNLFHGKPEPAGGGDWRCRRAAAGKRTQTTSPAGDAMKTIRWVLLILLAAGLPARAYVLNYNSLTNVQHWNFSRPTVPCPRMPQPHHARLRYYLASDGYSTTNTAAELNSVRAALGQWQAISNTVIKFEEAGLVNPPVDVNTSDNTNIIYWTKTTTLVNGGHSDISGALGVTFTSFTVTSNELLQADIVFNGDLYQWFTDFFDPNNPEYFCGDRRVARDAAICWESTTRRSAAPRCFLSATRA